MGNLNQFFRDLGRNAYGLGENVASLGSAAIAEPVAGFAAMYDPANGAQAIREGMTYTPRTQAGQMYQQGAARTLGAIAQPAMPVIDTWQRGVDIAGGYSPAAGAALQTVPTALGALLGYKPALQAGRQVSNSLGAMQARMIANANAPRTLNTGYMGQRGTFAGINALTADRQALAKAQQMIAQGVDPEDVWQETGWGRGADGKWRFEIDDSKAKIRDYQFTPRAAYEQARTDAFINESEPMRERAASMRQYAGMTKTQLKEEYKRTGDEIINAALNGDMQKAKNLSASREGLDSLLSQMSNRQYGGLSSFMAHGDLGMAYPDAYKIHTRISPDDVGTANAHYNRGSDTQSEQIVMKKKPFFDSDKSTILHELQHAIQQREGFAKGGSPEQFKKTQLDLEKEKWASIVNQTVNDGESIDSVLNELKKEVLDRGIDDSTYSHDDFNAVLTLIQSKEPKSLIDKWIKDGQIKHDPYESYRSLAGEVEARTTQSRMDLNAQQRRENYPFDYRKWGYDVPEKSQIVDFGNNKASAKR